MAKVNFHHSPWTSFPSVLDLWEFLSTEDRTSHDEVGVAFPAAELWFLQLSQL